MTSIIIYTRPEVLEHKQGKICDDDWSEFGEYVWNFEGRLPKRLEPTDKIYFATKGFIRGYFKIEDITFWDVVFNINTWKDITPIPTKSFQGFKYADKVHELGSLIEEEK